jgi:hypothetical protein
MTESKSKWEVAVCWRNHCLLALAMSLAWAAPVFSAEVDGSAESAGAVADAAPAPSAESIRANLASVAASAFEPAREGAVDLATFAMKPAAAMLTVPPPGSLSPAPPAKDHIPEPGAIGFGLAVAALIVGNFTKALMRCWKITSTNPNRES